jgi:hypothetical protein
MLNWRTYEAQSYYIINVENFTHKEFGYFYLKIDAFSLGNIDQ